MATSTENTTTTTSNDYHSFSITVATSSQSVSQSVRPSVCLSVIQSLITTTMISVLFMSVVNLLHHTSNIVQTTFNISCTYNNNVFNLKPYHTRRYCPFLLQLHCLQHKYNFPQGGKLHRSLLTCYH